MNQFDTNWIYAVDGQDLDDYVSDIQYAIDHHHWKRAQILINKFFFEKCYPTHDKEDN